MIPLLLIANYIAWWLIACWVGRGKFAWYDLWIGVYYDRKTGIIYICLLPCLLIWIDF